MLANTQLLFHNDMYPEGWLIDPKGKSFLFFIKDQSSQQVIGSIQKWNATNGSPTTLKSSYSASAKEAITKWIELTEEGWRRVDTIFNIEAA